MLNNHQPKTWERRHRPASGDLNFSTKLKVKIDSGLPETLKTSLKGPGMAAWSIYPCSLFISKLLLI